MEGLAAQISLVIFIILVVYFGSFTPEKKAARRKAAYQKFADKHKNSQFIESIELKEISESLTNSQIIFPKDSYNQSFKNVVKIEENDFTIYLGEYFYQQDVKRDWMDQYLPKHSGKGINPIHYNDYNWPSNVPKPQKISEEYFNFYYYQKLCIIKPNIKTYYPDFAVKAKKLGTNEFENLLELDDQTIFNHSYMLAAPKASETKVFFNNGKVNVLCKQINKNYIYETIDGLIIVKSEATFFDSLEKLHQSSINMFTNLINRF